MNLALTVAIVLLVLIGAAHSYLGERYILMRLFRRGPLPRLFGSDLFTRRTLRFAWHITTIAWWGAAATLWALAGGSARGGILAVSATFAVSAAVALIGSRGRHLAWLVFAIIAGCAWLGAPGR
jgi:hypothetical protein